ncbi:cleaved adhesin domain-containing protein, partial [Marinirhabdus gelatinilytica]
MRLNVFASIIFFVVSTTSFFAQIPYLGEASDYMPSEHPTKVVHPTNFYITEPARDFPQVVDRSIFQGKVVPRGATGPANSLSPKRQRKLDYLNSAGESPSQIDPLMQGAGSFSRASETRAPIVDFEGIGLNVSPPDPSMAVGPNHIVTMENGLWSVYDKSGNQAPGFPKNLTDPLSAPGSTANAGDPIVMYDRQADRWFISQFQLPGSNTFLIGISTTSDPTGTYYVYEYNLGAGNDYPHYGVWGDSYVTAGNFSGAQKVYTFNRTKMLAGDSSAEIVGFSPANLGTSGFAAPIPVHSERDVTPTGPIKIVFYQDDAFSGVATDHIGLWNITMDWNNIGASTISGKNQIPTASFDAAIAGGFSNLEQPGTTQRIDAIVGAVMNMCHWYEFGSHQSIVMNWVVEIQDGTQKSGIRWVELRSTDNGASWSVYQEGTFTDPAGATVAQKESVFMGCITMDEDGNIGLGYTKTGASTFPSLYYTGRLATDPLGTMSFGENLVVLGTNSVTGNDRYGDYGQGVTDPSDDKTFWVTSEYSGDGGTNGRQVRIYSYKIEPDSPEISFATTSESISESDTACFTDIDVPLTIGLGPSQDAVVTFSINGSSTATTNLDFELLTNSVTFLAGETANKLMSLRIYHDGFVEVDETVVIDFTVNANGGDATANPNGDQYTLTISSTDASPAVTSTTALLNEDFESVPAGWAIIDQDGDGNNWAIGIPPGPPAHLVTQKLFSQSWAGSALTPDNYLLTNEITIPANLDAATLTYEVAPATLTQTWYEEYYTVYWATDISSVATINASPQVKPGGIINQAVEVENIDMSPYIGETGYLIFRHHNCTDEEYISIDDMLLEGTFATNVQTAVNTANPDQLRLNGPGTSFSYDPTSNNVMAAITNNNSENYGCSTIAVSRAGTTSQGYNGSTGSDEVMDKRFTISATNTPASGDTAITFYIDSTELSGWETATGNTSGTYAMYIGRESGGVLEDVVAATVGAFGSHTTFTGDFTGTDGDYYFGLETAFVSCSGVVRTWNGSAWSPSGTPDTLDQAIIAGNYNTVDDGDLDVCQLTVDSGATLTVGAGDYLRTESNIVVNGTLQVDHQGSVVQVDPSATVLNNGTINVDVT